MTSDNEMTVLEREKNALIEDFKRRNPELFAQYEDIIAFGRAEERRAEEPANVIPISEQSPPSFVIEPLKSRRIGEKTSPMKQSRCQTAFRLVRPRHFPKKGIFFSI